MNPRYPLLAGGIAATLLAACGKDSGPSDQGQMAKQAGDGQTATVATSLAPYQVLVTDMDGAPKAGVTVSWRVVLGGGVVDPASVVTGTDGLGSTVATLGTVAGTQSVRASASGYGGSPEVFVSTGTAGPMTSLNKAAGDNQHGHAGTALPVLPAVVARDQYDNPVAGVTVNWSVTSGSGSISAPTSVTGADGRATVSWTLGAGTGSMTITAAAGGFPALTFSAIATLTFSILGGGNNVPERYTSDLWVADGFAYTGTWGSRPTQGNAVKIWQLSPSGAPVLHDSIITPNTGTISDIQVSDDGKWLVFTSESGTNAGLHVYELTAPGQPVLRAEATGVNLHTGTLATIGGKLYDFTAKDPANCALRIYDLSAAASGSITLASATPIPDHYCIHDTFVRDGYAFVFAWDEGLYIFDVGNGSHGGSPEAPSLISHTGSQTSPVFGGQTHNGWWFWNPTNGEKKYLFIGEEGPATIGGSASGDIHVVDVSDFSHPIEVASYSVPGAGTHNFWIDEPQQILYAAYYNGGVVALDISGTLSGDLALRQIDRITPGGGGNTFVWGVMLYGGTLYASDMLSGLWQLGVP